MHSIRKIIIIGFAIFAMLFGSGNVVFPLILGRDSGNHLFFALAGFLCTAVLIPILGLLATMLYHGDYEALLAPLGKLPRFLVIAICMVLIGPFAIIPRCITLSHAALHAHWNWLPLGLFSLISAAVIFAATVKPGFVIELLGNFLGPIKVLLLGFIVVKGVLMPTHLNPVSINTWMAAKAGLLAGYGTCDLIATIFLSGLIISGLQKVGIDSPSPRSKAFGMIRAGVAAAMIAGILLGLIYGGFGLVAGFHGKELQSVPQVDLFSHVALLVLGHYGGFFADITIAISCLTTAIALVSVFAMYLHQGVFRGKLAYLPALVITIIISSSFSLLGFDEIMVILKPALEILYPFLILFTIGSIFFRVRQLRRHEAVDLSIHLESSDWNES